MIVDLLDGLLKDDSFALGETKADLGTKTAKKRKEFSSRLVATMSKIASLTGVACRSEMPLHQVEEEFW